MKKISVIILALLACVMSYAQHRINPFFDDMGIVRLETQELKASSDTLVSVFHRSDDVVWSRVVYRIIDMRFKQNYQLYFPTKSDDADYRNLFKVITDAVVDGLPIYEKNMETIKPDFKQEPLSPYLIPTMFMADDPLADYSDDPTHFDITSSDAMLIHYDSIADELSFHFYPFEQLVKNQLKYLIQEVVFFNKHTSRLHTKIMAIAPLQSDKISTRDNSNIMGSLRESIMFWIPFDALRPYMALQYAIPNRNEVKRVTYDEFFQKHLYTSYIVGEGNMYNRWIPDYAGTEEQVKKEQERIATELLNFEQDLWEY